MNIEPTKPRLLSEQIIPQLTPALKRYYGIENDKLVSIGLVTCDMDDALYVALDEATKHSPIDVVYAKSFYAGSGHASGPISGEAIGVIAGEDPSHVQEGLKALRNCLENQAWFYTILPDKRANFFPHVVRSVGYYLSKVAEVPVGSALAYLIACPMEAMVGIDAAMKVTPVEIKKFYGPPTETNFGGALLSGTIADCEAAALAFTETILKIHA